MKFPELDEAVEIMRILAPLGVRDRRLVVEFVQRMLAVMPPAATGTNRKGG